MRVIGMRDVNFKDRETGRTIAGTSLYVSYPIEGEGVGEASEKYFIKPDVDISAVKVGDDIEVSCNRYGKVQRVYVL